MGVNVDRRRRGRRRSMGWHCNKIVTRLTQGDKRERVILQRKAKKTEEYLYNNKQKNT